MHAATGRILVATRAALPTTRSSALKCCTLLAFALVCPPRRARRDSTTLAVGCYDLAQFVSHIPHGGLRSCLVASSKLHLAVSQCNERAALGCGASLRRPAEANVRHNTAPFMPQPAPLWLPPATF